MKLTRYALAFALAAAALDAAPRIQRIQLSITNPVPLARTENVVLPVAQLKRIAPGFAGAQELNDRNSPEDRGADTRVLQRPGSSGRLICGQQKVSAGVRTRLRGCATRAQQR